MHCPDLCTGFFNGALDWLDSGHIRLVYRIFAIPAIEYHSNPALWRAQQMVPDLVLLGLIVFFFVLTANDTFREWSIEQKSRTMVRRKLQTKARAANPDNDDNDDEDEDGKPRYLSTPKSYSARTGLAALILNILICTGMAVCVGVWFASAISVYHEDELRSR
jgi:hypothetical protein